MVVRFGSLHPFTVRKIGDFPHFLSALTSNNQFIIKLVKMWPGGTPHVVVGAPIRLGIRSQNLGQPNEYSLGHCGLSAASRHKLAFTTRHFVLFTATDTTALY